MISRFTALAVPCWMCVKLLREHSGKLLISVQGECVCLYGWLCSRHSAGWLNSRLVMQQISGERIRGVVRCGHLHPAEHRCLMTALLMSADTWWMRPYGQTACRNQVHNFLLAFSRGKEAIAHSGFVNSRDMMWPSFTLQRFCIFYIYSSRRSWPFLYITCKLANLMQPN